MDKFTLELELEKAKQFIEHKDIDSAIKILNCLDKKNKNNFEVLFTCAVLYLKINRNRDAISFLKKAITIKDDANVKLLLIKALKDNGEYRESLKLCFELKKKKQYIEELDEETLRVLLKLNKFITSKKYVIKYIREKSVLEKVNQDIIGLFKSLKNIGRYRDSLNLLLRLKRNNIDVDEKEIVELFIILKKYNIAKEYIYKYLNKNDIYSFFGAFFCSFDFNFCKEKELIDLEKVCWCFLEDDNFNNKKSIELLLLKLYCLNDKFFSKRNKFFEYIKSKLLFTDQILSKKEYNLILNLLEITNKANTLISKPISLSVSLTSKCNAKCKFCSLKENWEISNALKKEIIELLPFLYHVSWTGGEVFLYDKFHELFNLAKEYNVKQEVVTNGMLLNKKWIDELITSNTKLAISIRSVEQDKYEMLTTGAKFNILMQKLEYIKDNLYKKHSRFEFAMYVLVTKYNFMELEKLVDFAYKFDFDKIRFIQLDNIENSAKEQNICSKNHEHYDALIDSFNKAIYMASKYGIQVINELPITDSKSFYNFKKKNNDEEIENIIRKLKKGLEINAFETNLLNYNNFLDIKNNISFCIYPWNSVTISNGGVKMVTALCSSLQNDDEKTSIEKFWNSNNIKFLREKIVNKDFKDICNSICFR